MHKIHDKEFTLDDFSHEDMGKHEINMLTLTIGNLNANRDLFIETKDKIYWRRMIQMLPTSYNQKRTIDISYETALSIILDRRNHKLDEFVDLCSFFIINLPYMSDIIKSIK